MSASERLMELVLKMVSLEHKGAMSTESVESKS